MVGGVRLRVAGLPLFAGSRAAAACIFSMAFFGRLSWVWIATFVAVVVGCSAVHEGAHVVMGRRFGWRLTQIRVGWLGASVSLATADGFKRNRDQLVVSLMGPVAEVAAAAAVLGLTHLAGMVWWLTGWGAAAVLMAVNGALGLLPLHPGSDGAKLFRTGWATVRGRGDEVFVLRPSGEATA